MSGCIYRFERVSGSGIASPSQAAQKILSFATYFVRGIKFRELTDRSSPKPLFAVLFAHHAAKHYFGEMFECLMECSGLRAEVLQPIEEESLQFNGVTRAANATAFAQSQLGEGQRHSIPPSLKEWVQANSR